MTDSPPPRVLVLSPHFDDAVFSCPGWIREQARSGNRPLVVTVFAGIPEQTNPAAGEAIERRRQEDRKALENLGAEPRFASFPEAPLRSRLYGSFSGLTSCRLGNDARLAANIEADLHALLLEERPSTLLAPLGVGHHVDHQIVQEVASRLASRHPQTKLLFYEDRPYAFVEEAVRVRLSQLGRRSHPADFRPIPPALRSERFFLSFFGAPYTRQNLRTLDHARVVTHMLSLFAQSLQEPLQRARWSTSTWGMDVLRDLLLVLDAYSPRGPGFLGSPLYHQWASMEYARRMGYAGKYVERYWYL